MADMNAPGSMNGQAVAIAPSAKHGAKADAILRDLALMTGAGLVDLSSAVATRLANHNGEPGAVLDDQGVEAAIRFPPTRLMHRVWTGHRPKRFSTDLRDRKQMRQIVALTCRDVCREGVYWLAFCRQTTIKKQDTD